MCDDFSYINEACLIDDFSFGNGNFSNYNIQMFQGLSESPNTDGSLTMLTSTWQCSMIFSKAKLNELMQTRRNVLVSITIQMDEVNDADGYFIMFFDKLSFLTANPIGMLHRFFFYTFTKWHFSIVDRLWRWTSVHNYGAEVLFSPYYQRRNIYNFQVPSPCIN